jgi:ATP-dependent Lon protease
MGLANFPHYEMNDAFDFGDKLQRFRPVKAFEMTHLRVEGSPAIGIDHSIVEKSG